MPKKLSPEYREDAKVFTYQIPEGEVPQERRLKKEMAVRGFHYVDEEYEAKQKAMEKQEDEELDDMIAKYHADNPLPIPKDSYQNEHNFSDM